jgi:hypothetical protein
MTLMVGSRALLIVLRTTLLPLLPCLPVLMLPDK